MTKRRLQQAQTPLPVPASSAMQRFRASPVPSFAPAFSAPFLSTAPEPRLTSRSPRHFAGFPWNICRKLLKGSGWNPEQEFASRGLLFFSFFFFFFLTYSSFCEETLGRLRRGRRGWHARWPRSVFFEKNAAEISTDEGVFWGPGGRFFRSQPRLHELWYPTCPTRHHR